MKWHWLKAIYQKKLLKDLSVYYTTSHLSLNYALMVQLANNENYLGI